MTNQHTKLAYEKAVTKVMTLATAFLLSIVRPPYSYHRTPHAYNSEPS